MNMENKAAPTWEELNRNTLVKNLMACGYSAKYAVNVLRTIIAHDALVAVAVHASNLGVVGADEALKLAEGVTR